MSGNGIHHVTAITADVEANLDFYARLLGLRLVWQGVNADDPEIRHVAYGDECGNPGSVVTFPSRVSPITDTDASRTVLAAVR